VSFSPASGLLGGSTAIHNYTSMQGGQRLFQLPGEAISFPISEQASQQLLYQLDYRLMKQIDPIMMY
jgi:hypothetical protein